MWAKIALTLVIIGAINWLLIGVFRWDIVSTLFGGPMLRDASGLSRVVYVLIGISGLAATPLLFRDWARIR